MWKYTEKGPTIMQIFSWPIVMCSSLEVTKFCLGSFNCISSTRVPVEPHEARQFSDSGGSSFSVASSARSSHLAIGFDRYWALRNISFLCEIGFYWYHVLYI